MNDPQPLSSALDILIETNPEKARQWFKNREIECRHCLDAARKLIAGDNLTAALTTRAPNIITDTVAALYTQTRFNIRLVEIAMRVWPQSWPNEEIGRTSHVAECARHDMAATLQDLKILRDFVGLAQTTVSNDA